MSDATELVVRVDESRWIPIPRALEGAHRTAWLHGAVDTATRASEHWDAPADELVPQIVEHALDLRGDDELVLQYWPDVVPAAVLVRIEVSEAGDRGAVAARLRSEARSRVEQIASDGLGPGYEWVHSAPLPGDDTDSLIGTQYLFLDDDVMVLITLDPTLPAVFQFVIDEVREFVASVELSDRGRRWRSTALAPDVGTRRDLETWPRFEGS